MKERTRDGKIVIGFCATPALRAELKRRAKLEDRALANWIERHFVAFVERSGRRKKAKTAAA